MGTTGKKATKIPGNGSYLADGPDLDSKEPTPYLYNEPTNAPHVSKHQSGIGGPSDRNSNRTVSYTHLFQ